VKFSLWTATSHPWPEILDDARFVEGDGWHGLWCSDHFMSKTVDDTPGDGPTLECWSVLGAVAALIPRIRVTSMVSPLTIHHPVGLAKRVTTIDHISGGRVTVGVGAGWQQNEHAAYGFDLPEPAERVARFAEGLQVLRSLLHDDRANFAGAWFNLVDAPFQPKPLQDPIPIVVGTAGPRMMRLIARFADEWNTWGSASVVGERTALFHEICDAVGRDPATVRRSAQAMVFFADDERTRDELMGRVPAARSFVGTSAQLVDELGALAEGGIDEFALNDAMMSGSAAERRETLQRFSEDVMVHYR
jgi:probable F420-dependent oxidoreductase